MGLFHRSLASCASVPHAVRSAATYRRAPFRWQPLHHTPASRKLPFDDLCASAQGLPTRHLSLTGCMLQACAPSTRVRGYSLVRFELDHTSGVAVFELHDPGRFNTITKSMGDDARRLVAHARRRGDLRAMVLQAAGHVFCAGGNPYESSITASLVNFSREMFENTAGFVGMRSLSVPVVSEFLSSCSSLKHAKPSGTQPLYD